MRKIIYNYYLPLRNLFRYEDDIEKISSWVEFRKEWDNEEELLIILPVSTFDLTGLDIRYVFREFGRRDNVRFLLIGTTKQIEFSLSQNDKFLGNIVEQVILPIDYDVFEIAVLKKINKLENAGKGKKLKR